MTKRLVWGLLAALTAAIAVVVWFNFFHEPRASYQKGDEQLGGAGGVAEQGKNAFSLPSTLLTDQQQTDFFVGNSFFKKPWVESPSSTTARDGLGPHFIASSCGGCHTLDGRGNMPPVFDGLTTEQPMGLLLRLSVLGKNGEQLPEPTYGGQFNNQAIQGVKPEGEVEIVYTELKGQFADGTPYSLHQPTYRFKNLSYGAMHPNTLVSPRLAPQMIGLGLLEAITEQDVLTNQVRQRELGMTAGVANYVTDAVSGKTMLGRFGWKANVPTVTHQTAGAFHGDIGITSSLFPEQDCTQAQKDCMAAPNGNDAAGHEISDDILNQVILYSKTLAVPNQREASEPLTLRGKQLFREAQCVACHVEKYTTGLVKDFPALSGQAISPFTDLLLHDMGEGLADHRPDGLANGRQWRTPPLWGIGLLKAVNGYAFYLHDGRARDVSEAILWHGGSATKSRDAFLNMNAADRKALLHFLNTL
ncbi:hypothetical protein GCM10009007_15980 [Formosimonas limnophila]|uniref:Cytochrome c domain-containing protein n=1 Tax=Formosimonas limnophila TaxID=1384487 RepID=A0A8J3CNH1_9BURK|nr:di-heme oxidoredictase family protein [Formosimonas limnophila]GHA75601.1 hypothetical protein GCM10009007_15980 [Formosimonas limnophila]